MNFIKEKIYIFIVQKKYIIILFIILFLSIIFAISFFLYKKTDTQLSYNILYSNFFNCPSVITPGGNDDMYIYDRCLNKVARLAKNGIYSVWAKTGEIEMSSVVYQKPLNRLIGVSKDGIYSIRKDSVELLKSTSQRAINITDMVSDPNTGYIYASSWLKKNFPIMLFDENFNFIKDIKKVDYVHDLFLDSSNNLLYYTEAAKGSVNVLDLATNNTKVLRENLGGKIPDESVGVTLDDKGNIYYSNFTDGVFKYNSRTEREEKIMDIPLGHGNIFWWASNHAMLQPNIFAGTIVKMYPVSKKTHLLESNVNSFTTAMSSNGDIYYVSELQLYKYDGNKIIAIGRKLDYNPFFLLFDDKDNLLASSANSIIKISTDNARSENYINFDDDVTVKKIDYDASNDEIVVVISRANGQKSIWRVANKKGSTPRLVVNLGNFTTEDILLTVDKSNGNIYYYNNKKDVVYKIDERHQKNIKILSGVNTIVDDSTPIDGLTYSFRLKGFVLSYLDRGIFYIPLKGDKTKAQKVKYPNCNKNCGMDYTQVYENIKGELAGTYAGVIYKISGKGIPK